MNQVRCKQIVIYLVCLIAVFTNALTEAFASDPRDAMFFNSENATIKVHTTNSKGEKEEKQQ